MVTMSFLLWHWIYFGFQSFSVATAHWTILFLLEVPTSVLQFQAMVESSSMAGTDWKCARGPARWNSDIRERLWLRNEEVLEDAAVQAIMAMKHETWPWGWPDDPGRKCEGIDGKKKTDQSSSQAKVWPDDLTASGQQNDGRQLPTSLGCNGPGLPGPVQRG